MFNIVGLYVRLYSLFDNKEVECYGGINISP